MSGMEGFTHSCEETKVEKDLYRASLLSQPFFEDFYKKIYDFYLTNSFAADTQQKIQLKDYGWEGNSNERGLKTLEDLLSANAGIGEMCMIRSTTIKDTLEAMDLSGTHICIEHARAVMLQRYSTKIDENEEVTFDNKETRIKCLFRHIRNALAHGGTYFFKNRMMLIEDYESAKILIPQQSLIDWINIVDQNHIIK
jgi:hypothetical protein